MSLGKMSTVDGAFDTLPTSNSNHRYNVEKSYQVKYRKLRFLEKFYQLQIWIVSKMSKDNLC